MPQSLKGLLDWVPEIGDLAKATRNMATAHANANEFYQALVKASTWHGQAAQEAMMSMLMTAAAHDVRAEDMLAAAGQMDGAEQDAAKLANTVKNILDDSADAPAVEVDQTTNAVSPPLNYEYLDDETKTNVSQKIADLEARIADALAEGDRIDADLAKAMAKATGMPEPTKTATTLSELLGVPTDRPPPGGKGIEVDNDAINGSQAPIAAPTQPQDPRFGSSHKNVLERTLSGTGGRADGEVAVGYLRARGWNTSADLIQHYLANESGDGDPSIGKSFQLSSAQTDALANDAVSGYPGVKALPTVLENARQTALQDAAQSGKSVFTEVYGTEPGVQRPLGPGWNPVGGSDPNNVYALGRHSVQVVTQVESAPGQDPTVRQRFYVYDYTDFEHNTGTITNPGNLSNPTDAGKMTVIDELSTLRDIGYARGFNTYGTSSIRTYP